MANEQILETGARPEEAVPRGLKPRQLKVLAAALLAHPDPVYGYELIEKTRISAGNLYPILIDLERQGLLVSRWVDSEAGPRRRVYNLSENRVPLLRKLVNDNLEGLLAKDRPSRKGKVGGRVRLGRA